jgi:hypothetical protein
MEILTGWATVISDAPAFAERVAAAFQAGTNKTLATIRADGSPRISGTELEFVDGRVTLGMMPRSRKLADVLRDPRVALHSPTLEPSAAGTLDAGDAKLAGLLVEIPDPANPTGTSFELDITEVVLTTVDEERGLLVVESWHPGRGYEKYERK